MVCEPNAWSGTRFFCEAYIDGHAKSTSGWQSTSNVYLSLVATNAFMMRWAQCRINPVPNQLYLVQYYNYFPPPWTTQAVSTILECYSV